MMRFGEDKFWTDENKEFLGELERKDRDLWAKIKRRARIKSKYNENEKKLSYYNGL